MPHKIFLTAAFSKQVQWEQVQKRKNQLKGTTAGNNRRSKSADKERGLWNYLKHPAISLHEICVSVSPKMDIIKKHNLQPWIFEFQRDFSIAFHYLL